LLFVRTVSMDRRSFTRLARIGRLEAMRENHKTDTDCLPKAKKRVITVHIYARRVDTG